MTWLADAARQFWCCNHHIQNLNVTNCTICAGLYSVHLKHIRSYSQFRSISDSVISIMSFP